jgi:hypothetical protein
MLVKQLNNIWFGTYKLRVNIRRYQSATARTTHQITSRKSPAQHAPVTVTERDSRSYAMVVRTGHRKDLSAANQEICSESNSIVHMPVVAHGPSEEERARLQNCLVGVISEGVSYQQIRDSLLAKAVRFNRFRFKELDPLHFPVFEAIEYNIRTFSPMLDEEDDE